MKTRLGPARREEAVDTFVRYTATPAAVSRLDCSTILDFKPMSDSARVRPSASSVWLAGVSSSICVVAGGAVAAFLLGLCASDFWICELLTHFRVHYALVLLAAGGLLLVCGGPKRGIAAVGAGLCISATLAPLYWSPAESPPIMKWRLVSANLFVGNQQPEKFVSFLEESRPDVVVCLEVTSKWAAVLDGLQTQYPHQVIEPRRGAFGVALLSRLPLSDVRVEQASPDNPVIVASIKISGDDVATVVAVHPVPPVAPDWTALRNQQLERIGQLASDCKRPVVLAGDLNTTSWSPVFAELLNTSGLRDSRAGFGIQASWPSGLVPLGIPIDHVLISSELAVVRRWIGPDVGADHRPIVIDLGLKNP